MKHKLTADNCRSKREGFAGRDNLGAIKSLPRTANPNREKSGPRLGFLGSGRNLKSLPFGLRNYRLSNGLDTVENDLLLQIYNQLSFSGN